jgi:hypothetical protein
MAETSGECEALQEIGFETIVDCKLEKRFT